MCGLLTVQEVVGASNLHIVQGSTVFCFLQLGKTPLNLRVCFSLLFLMRPSLGLCLCSLMLLILVHFPSGYAILIDSLIFGPEQAFLWNSATIFIEDSRT